MTQNEFNNLLNNIKSLSPGQRQRLRQHLGDEAVQPDGSRVRPPARRSKSAQAAVPPKKPLTRDELNQQLMAAGLITRLPDPSMDLDDDDPADAPVTLKGEPLSETIIRERR